MYHLRSGATDGNCHNCKCSLVVIGKCDTILHKEKSSCFLEWIDYPAPAELRTQQKLRASCSSVSC